MIKVKVTGRVYMCGGEGDRQTKDTYSCENTWDTFPPMEDWCLNTVNCLHRMTEFQRAIDYCSRYVQYIKHGFGFSFIDRRITIVSICPINHGAYLIYYLMYIQRKSTTHSHSLQVHDIHLAQVLAINFSKHYN